MEHSTARFRHTGAIDRSAKRIKSIKSFTLRPIARNPDYLVPRTAIHPRVRVSS
jgi:hypothetical protein